jgi:ATP synthase proteolipid subunit
MKARNSVALFLTMAPANVSILQSLIPVVMSGIIAVYGLVIAVLIAGALNPASTMSLYTYVETLKRVRFDKRLTKG